MDTRPIGVFDSGLGGLTAVRKLMEVMPGEDIIYFGDTGRVPYGGRSKQTIVTYARQDIAFLQSLDIKAIVAACGTVSTNALEDIQCEYDLPVMGVVEAAVRRAAELTRTGRVGLIATAASVRSGTYARVLKKYAPEASLTAQACPLFVPLVENGRVSADDVVLRTVAGEYLESLKRAEVDTLILGCTHYPLISGCIAEIMGPDVMLISPGEETAKAMKEMLTSHGMLSGRDGGGKYSYYVSDSTEDFAHMASLFLETDVAGEVRRVTVDSF